MKEKDRMEIWHDVLAIIVLFLPLIVMGVIEILRK